MKIDWNEAPEWAIGHALHVSGGGEIKEVWVGEHQYQRLDQSKAFAYGGGEGDSRHNPRRYQFKYETLRPAPWTGEGTPPVGTHVEWWSPKYSWLGGTVVGHDGTATIVRHNDGYEGCYSDRIRPIRTPEQIAAEERDNAVAELAGEIAGWSNREESSIGQDLLAMYLHDHGYRKQVKS